MPGSCDIATVSKTASNIYSTIYFVLSEYYVSHTLARNPLPLRI